MDRYQAQLCAKLKIEKYDGLETEAFQHDCVRLQKGEPYEYVLGYTNFLGVHIDLSLRPMIPRPESAFWVARAIEELKEKVWTINRPLVLAETFAGSGAIGLALLKHLPNAVVTISELDPNLKKQIEINIEQNGIDPHRATIITASGLDGLVNERSYDAIFAVPPYIPHEALSELDQDMIDYEPHMAFFAHDNGHEFHTLLIDGAYDLLHKGGTLYMEADMGHEDWVRAYVKGTRWSAFELWPDPYGATPNVILRK